MISKKLQLALFAALTVLLLGCGNKGDLYLPPESANTFAATAMEQDAD